MSRDTRELIAVAVFYAAIVFFLVMFFGPVR